MMRELAETLSEPPRITTNRPNNNTKLTGFVLFSGRLVRFPNRTGRLESSVNILTNRINLT